MRPEGTSALMNFTLAAPVAADGFSTTDFALAAFLPAIEMRQETPSLNAALPTLATTSSAPSRTNAWAERSSAGLVTYANGKLKMMFFVPVARAVMAPLYLPGALNPCSLGRFSFSVPSRAPSPRAHVEPGSFWTPFAVSRTSESRAFTEPAPTSPTCTESPVPPNALALTRQNPGPRREKRRPPKLSGSRNPRLTLAHDIVARQLGLLTQALNPQTWPSRGRDAPRAAYGIAISTSHRPLPPRLAHCIWPFHDRSVLCASNSAPAELRMIWK